jgi:hypothetical protein
MFVRFCFTVQHAPGSCKAVAASMPQSWLYYVPEDFMQHHTITRPVVVSAGAVVAVFLK